MPASPRENYNFQSVVCWVIKNSAHNFRFTNIEYEIGWK